MDWWGRGTHSFADETIVIFLKGRLQSKHKFVLKVAFLYADIPAKNNFSEKFMIWHPEAKRYKYLIIMTTDPPTHDIRSSHSWRQILLLMTSDPATHDNRSCARWDGYHLAVPRPEPIVTLIRTFYFATNTLIIIACSDCWTKIINSIS